ncbi:MAG: hypothetical protein Q4D43_07855 [Clostridia bacterium]|nr:hypothetical protein [Clostridia bacterium]
MKDPIIYNCPEFPAQFFGEGIVREVRLIAAPETTGESRIRIVHTTVPAGGISDGHIHPDADEYIFFDIPGRVILDGVPYDVPAHGMVHAISGVNHECVNTDPAHTLHLLCLFVPAFKPYGGYPELIEKTKKYIDAL